MSTDELLLQCYKALSAMTEIKNDTEYAEIINDISRIESTLNRDWSKEKNIHSYNDLFNEIYNKYILKPEFAIITNAYNIKFNGFNLENNNQKQILSEDRNLYNLRKWLIRYFNVRVLEDTYGKKYFDKYGKLLDTKNMDELETDLRLTDEEVCEEVKKITEEK